MRRATAALAIAAAAGFLATVAPPAIAAIDGLFTAGAADVTPRSPVSVDLDWSAASTTIGGRLGFTSTVRNDSSVPLTGVVVHLNVLSVDPAVYVDPEDWSAERTQYIDVLPPGSAHRVSWETQAVNAGRFVIYVGVTTRTTPQGADTVTASRALRLAVAAQRSLNPGGIVPVAAGMPVAVLVLLALVLRRRRRLR